MEQDTAEAPSPAGTQPPALLETPVAALGLKMEGSLVEPFLKKLLRELTDKGLRRFKPSFYLTDEWGCP